jgi:hypothetical protein
MNKGRMVFSQVMDFASQDIFKVCVNRYNGNYKAKEFTCWKQFFMSCLWSVNPSGKYERYNALPGA